MKNYFIANGEILNTDMSLEEIESQVQESLNENTSGMAQFRIKEISEKEVRFFADQKAVPVHCIDVTIAEVEFSVGRKAGVIGICDEGFAKKLTELIG